MVFDVVGVQIQIAAHIFRPPSATRSDTKIVPQQFFVLKEEIHT
jgi:hypothetical protein